MADHPPRIFVSHSSVDKPFVRRLSDDLRANGLTAWMDERELGIGDSIVTGIDGGLSESDYVVVVLSSSSIRSNWVQNEIAAATMMEMANKGMAVLPVLLEDVEIPPLLAHRVYADFRQESSYDVSFRKLLSALKQEQSVVTKGAPATAAASPVSPSAGLSGSGSVLLGTLSAGGLRRRLVQRLSRKEVATLWFDIFGQLLDDDLPGSPKDVCVMELISRSRQQQLMDELLDNLCSSRPDLANA